MGRRVLLLGLFSCAVLVLLAGAVLVGNGTDPSSLPRPRVTLVQVEGPAPEAGLADVIEGTLPSVVNVKVRQVGFGDLGRVEEGRGQGSGVVLDESGLIVTNYHVVQEAFEVEVAFTDGTTLPGRVTGFASERDLALIQVDAVDLVPVTLGRSSSLRLGDEVIAIGFPLGLGGSPTVTKGIVSATERDIRPIGGSRLTRLLQTDAAINPGNSGGAMLDLAGRLVGINTAAAQAGSAENVGFAIPIDVALEVVQQILDAPAEEQAWLGVQIESLEAENATELGLPDGGALIAGVYPGSPAEDAGLEVGDVVVSVDDTPIETAEELIHALAELPPESDAVLQVRARSGMHEVRVTLGRRPGTFVVPQD